MRRGQITPEFGRQTKVALARGACRIGYRWEPWFRRTSEAKRFAPEH